jgi:hypothetical protein
MVATVEWGAETVALDVSALDAAVLELHAVQRTEGGAAPVASVFSPFHKDNGTKIKDSKQPKWGV